jgi:hypothetical protein
VQAYLDTQSKFIDLYHKANEIWSAKCVAKFENQVKQLLINERWNDINASAVLWQSKFIIASMAMYFISLLIQIVAVSGSGDNESLRLPGQATNAIIDALLTVCKEIHHAHSGTLDEVPDCSL